MFITEWVANSTWGPIYIYPADSGLVYPSRGAQFVSGLLLTKSRVAVIQTEKVRVRIVVVDDERVVCRSPSGDHVSCQASLSWIEGLSRNRQLVVQWCSR